MSEQTQPTRRSAPAPCTGSQTQHKKTVGQVPSKELHLDADSSLLGRGSDVLHRIVAKANIRPQRGDGIGLKRDQLSVVSVGRRPAPLVGAGRAAGGADALQFERGQIVVPAHRCTTLSGVRRHVGSRAKPSQVRPDPAQHGDQARAGSAQQGQKFLWAALTKPPACTHRLCWQCRSLHRRCKSALECSCCSCKACPPWDRWHSTCQLGCTPRCTASWWRRPCRLGQEAGRKGRAVQRFP